MQALQLHPWIVRPILSDWLNRTVRDSMQSAGVALNSTHSPRWIIALSETGRDYEAHTQIAVADSAAISILGDAHDGPLQSTLSATQSALLSDVLSDCTPSSIADVDHAVLDGMLCVVAVINGADNWCAFSEFNLAGMDHDQLASPGPRLATLIRSFHQDLRSVPSGP